MNIRPYHPDDEPGLQELERQSPQGHGIVLGMHRRRFATRADTFSDHEILVAEENGQLVGVGAVGIVPIVVGGKQYLTNFMFDWRVARSHRRRGIGKTLFYLLKEQWCAHHGASVTLSTLKSANIATRTGLRKNNEARWVRSFHYLSIPTARPLPLVSVRTADQPMISASLLSASGQRALWQTMECPRTETAISLWRTDQVYHLSVDRVAPWYAPVIACANRIGRNKGLFPKKGDDLSFSIISHLDRSTLHYLSCILRHLRGEQVTYATVVTDADDEIYRVLRPYAINDTEYLLVSDTDLGRGPIELDVRCL